MTDRFVEGHTQVIFNTIECVSWQRIDYSKTGLFKYTFSPPCLLVSEGMDKLLWLQVPLEDVWCASEQLSPPQWPWLTFFEYIYNPTSVLFFISAIYIFFSTASVTLCNQCIYVFCIMFKKCLSMFFPMNLFWETSMQQFFSLE